jgi:hypothetical protein
MRSLLISFTALAIAGTGASAFAQPSPNGWGNVQNGNAPYATAPDARQDDGRRDYANWQGDDRRGRDDHDNGRRGNGRPDGYRSGDDRRYNDDRRDDARDWQRGAAYSHRRPDPRYNGYYADNYYRVGSYQPRRLNSTDRIYRGQDNRYYCRRKDGTTGLIIGALGGGVLGNVIAPGGSKTLGSLLGGGLGAVLGNSIDRHNVTCR